jgi:hypothetical protein
MCIKVPLRTHLEWTDNKSHDISSHVVYGEFCEILDIYNKCWKPLSSSIFSFKDTKAQGELIKKRRHLKNLKAKLFTGRTKI